MKDSKRLDFELDMDTELEEIPFNNHGKLYEIIVVRCHQAFEEEYSEGFFSNKITAKFAASVEENYTDSDECVEIREYSPECWNAKEHCFDSWDTIDKGE